MRQLTIALALFALALVPMSASAQSCSQEVDGPYSFGGPIPAAYYVYTMPQCGWSTSSSAVSTTTLGCSAAEGWSIGNTGWINSPATITTSFTVGSQVVNPNQWQIQAHIQGSTPDASWYDYVEVDVTVTHPDNTWNSYSQLLYWNGSQGDDNGCQPRYSDYFSANTGDTITVTIQSGNPGGTGSIAISNPVLFNVQ